MKYIILTLITFSLNSFACQINIPTSEAQRYIDAMSQGKGVPPLYKCEDKPDEKCHCADSIIWEQAEITDIDVVDYVKKENAEKCEMVEIDNGSVRFSSYKDCDDKFEKLICKEGEAIKNYFQLEVYCAVNVMKKEKAIVNSEIKKDQKEAIEEAKKLAEKVKAQKIENAKQTLKELDINGATTVAKLKVIVKALLEAQE